MDSIAIKIKDLDLASKYYVQQHETDSHEDNKCAVFSGRIHGTLIDC